MCDLPFLSTGSAAQREWPPISGAAIPIAERPARLWCRKSRRLTVVDPCCVVMKRSLFDRVNDIIRHAAGYLRSFRSSPTDPFLALL